jgi:hypothetical protein
MEEQEKQQSTITLEDWVAEHQDRWNQRIAELNKRMKSVPDLVDLLNVVYAARQDAVEYYYSLLNKIAPMSRTYNQRYAAEYNNLKTNAQIRYTTEAAINAQIAANLADFLYTKDLLDIHARFMADTIKSIDNLIYGINHRIHLEELMEGVKK